jgi:hypothetical protein
MELILGLDCGLKTGWCLLTSNGEIYESGVQGFAKRRGESDGIVYLRFRRWLKKIMEDGVKVICYEQAHQRGGYATEILVGMITRIKEVISEFDEAGTHIDYLSVHSSTLKVFATGCGRSEKAAMIKSAVEFAGKEVTDDNEADAIHIARWALKEIDVPIEGGSKNAKIR